MNFNNYKPVNIKHLAVKSTGGISGDASTFTCPFCGGTVDCTDTGDGFLSIKCRACDLSGITAKPNDNQD